MNDDKVNCKGRSVLLISIAINIFLAAFILGRLSAPGLIHPSFRDEHMHPGLMHGDMPPPPFFSPGDLFSHDEMHENFEEMEKRFDKIHELRIEFAERLKKGSMTKEEVLKHFEEIDQIMDDVKDKAQEKAADKISSMSPEERQHFADRLLDR